MPDIEEKIEEEKEEIAPEDKNLIEEMQRLKRETVPKSKYDKLVERNKELSKALADQEQPAPIDNKPKEKNGEKIARLQKELYGDERKDCTNLDYISKTLELRDALMEEGYRDPFLPTKGKDKDSVEAKEAAKKVADGLKQMVKDSDGDPEMFRAIYQSRVEDVEVKPGKGNKIDIYRR